MIAAVFVAEHVVGTTLVTHAQQRSQATSAGAGATVFRGATLIDGSGSGPVADAVIAIAGERIIYVGDGTDLRVGPGARVINAAGRWIVPGFVDVHAHLPGHKEAPAFLATLVAFGTTTVRDPSNGHVLLRSHVQSGAVLGPQIRTAGNLIDDQDSFMGGERVSTPDDIRAVVRRQAADGTDWIKLYAGLSPPLVHAAIDEAHRLALPVVGHLGRTRWQEAIAFGVDSLTHSWFAGLAHSVVPSQHAVQFRDFYIPNSRFDSTLFSLWAKVVDPQGVEVSELASSLSKGRVSVDPNLVHGEAVTWGDTPSVLERLEPEIAGPAMAARWRGGRHPYSSGWSAAAMAAAKRAFPKMVAIIGVFHRKGVVLTVGSDYGNPWMTPGVAYHRELELLVSAGIAPLEVLRMATRNGADALGLLADTGTITVGKRADLLVLTANPLQDIRNTRRIERVVLRGQQYSQGSLLEAAAKH